MLAFLLFNILRPFLETSWLSSGMSCRWTSSCWSWSAPSWVLLLKRQELQLTPLSLGQKHFRWSFKWRCEQAILLWCFFKAFEHETHLSIGPGQVSISPIGEAGAELATCAIIEAQFHLFGGRTKAKVSRRPWLCSKSYSTFELQKAFFVTLKMAEANRAK